MPDCSLSDIQNYEVPDNNVRITKCLVVKSGKGKKAIGPVRLNDPPGPVCWVEIERKCSGFEQGRCAHENRDLTNG